MIAIITEYYAALNYHKDNIVNIFAIGMLLPTFPIEITYLLLLKPLSVTLYTCIKSIRIVLCFWELECGLINIQWSLTL